MHKAFGAECELIRTIARRGYQFTGEIRILSASRTGAFRPGGNALESARLCGRARAPLLQTARCDLLDGSGKDIYPTFSGFWVVRVIFCLIQALPQRVVRALAVMALILLIELHGLVAQAGVYTDDLSKCLVKSSDDADRLLLVQWIFSGLSLHPAVQPLVSITTEQREAFNDKVAVLFSRLLVDDCRKEAIDALKYEGSAALDASFQVLAQITSRDLMTEQHVVKGLNGLATHLANDEKLKSLLEAAGVPEPNLPTETPAK